jgi:drug/metabolite transporter (DMT)-like permease
LIATYTFLDGMGTRAFGSALAFLVWVDAIGSVGYLAVVPFRRSWRDIAAFARRDRFRSLGAGLIAFAGYFAYLNAITALPMAPVAAIRESSTVFGALAGVILFREAFGARRIAAAVAVTAGVLVIGLFGGSG